MGAVLATADVVQNVIALGALTIVAITAWLVLRGGGGTALEVLRTANGILERRVGELEKRGKDDAAQIASLQAKTDITVALRPLVKALELHEGHAKQRGDAQLAVLTMIANKLGPDTEPA